MLECATVVGALTGAFLAGLLSTWLLELLLAVVMCGRPFIDPQARPAAACPGRVLLYSF